MSALHWTLHVESVQIDNLVNSWIQLFIKISDSYNAEDADWSYSYLYSGDWNLILEFDISMSWSFTG